MKRAMFFGGGPRREAVAEVLAGLTVNIQDDGENVIVQARCRRSEIKYLLVLLNERLKRYEEEPAGPAIVRRRRA